MSRSSYFSQEIEIYFLSTKSTQPLPVALHRICWDSAGNRRVSSCTGCEYVGDYLHLPKLHWYRGCVVLRFPLSLSLLFICYCLKVFLGNYKQQTLLVPLEIAHYSHPYFSPPGILFVSWLCPPPHLHPNSVTNPLAMFFFPQLVTFWISVFMCFIPKEVCHTFNF